jgi:threonine/homoserine/homoserine lactone efflux protein
VPFEWRQPVGTCRDWVNPKGWLIGVAAVATFLDQRADGALGQAVLFAILFALAASPSCLPWLAFGAALQRFLRTPRAQRILNLAMAALLAASTIFVWARI